MGDNCVEVTVIVKPAVARALHGQGKSSAADGLRRAADALGLDLRPLDPSGSDPELARFFRADVDATRVPLVVERLRSSDAVEAAYAKPEDALP